MPVEEYPASPTAATPATAAAPTAAPTAASRCCCCCSCRCCGGDLGKGDAAKVEEAGARRGPLAHRGKASTPPPQALPPPPQALPACTLGVRGGHSEASVEVTAQGNDNEVEVACPLLVRGRVVEAT